VLNVKPAQHQASKQRSKTPAHLRRIARSREAAESGPVGTPQPSTAGKEAPFSPELWRSILDGDIQF
jgi:hypothetical protein